MKSFVILILTAILLSSTMIKAEAKNKPKKVSLNVFNTLLVEDQITQGSVFKNIAALIGTRVRLSAVGGPDAPLYVVLVSGGGSVLAGEYLLNMINATPNAVVICRWCASEAGYIFSQTTARRLVTKDSSLLMHEMTLTGVSAANMTIENILEFKKMSHDWNKKFSDMMKISLDKYESMILNSYIVYTGKDIVKHNLADELVTVECDEFISQLAPNTCGG